MTRLRSLALKISNVVVRRAPENSKEWAQAMAREMEFIPGDWAALRWTLGSTRILLECPETPISSLADVPLSARRFAKVIRKRTVSGCVVCMLETFMFMSFAHRMRNPTQRLGCYLVVGAMLYMAIQLLARRGSLSASSSLPASVEAYRLELGRQRDFHRGGWFWSRWFMMILGPLLFCIGGAIADPARAPFLAFRAPFLAFMVAVLLFGFVVGVAENLSRARKYQRRIDDLDGVGKNEA
jgi:hypothetical protein